MFGEETMKHSEIEELLSAYVDGELTSAQQEMVDLHLIACSDCQRTLAEFRLTRQQLALLADPAIAFAWRPDVVERVTARIRRRRRWVGFGQRLALDAVSVLAVGLVVAAVVWLLPHLNTSSDDAASVAGPPRTTRPLSSTPTPPERPTFLPSPPPGSTVMPSGQPSFLTPVPPMPTDGASTDATYITLKAQFSQTRLRVASAYLLRGRPASNAVQNLGFQLRLSSETPAEDVFIVLERPDGTQTFLDPAQAPSIPVPTSAQAGDSMRLFLWLRGGSYSPVVEFTLGRDADQSWLAVDAQQIDAAPSLKVALPPQLDTSQPTFMALEAPGDQFALYLFNANALQDAPTGDAVRNLGYRLSADVPDVFAIVEIVGGDQIVLNPADAPSIYLPSSAQAGDRVRLFATAPDGTISTPAAEFTLASEQGWQALDLQQSPAPVALRAELPTPTPQVVEPWPPLTPLPSFSRTGPEVTLRLERLYITPEQPFRGQPFTVTAVIRNLGDVGADRVTVWFGAYRLRQDSPTSSSSSNDTIIPAGEEVHVSWDGKSWLGGVHDLSDLSRESAHLTFRAGVNLPPPGGLYSSYLLPEADKFDNQAEISVEFLPYQPQVSDACPPGDNLWLELGQARAGQVYRDQTMLPVIVHNDGNVEVTRVALRLTDADGGRFLTYARWLQPCGGKADVDVGSFIGLLTYPLTITLNPTDASEARPENDRSDNVIVVSAGEACTGTTDLWLTDDDVAFEGDDLLVTLHLSGSAPTQSFWVRVYHTTDGSTIGDRRLSGLTTWSCDEPMTIRFEDALTGLRGGAVMVQIDTDAWHIEVHYPQQNNTATVPLP